MPHLIPQQPAISLRKAFYIKVGKGGRWEADSIARKIMRIGWPDNPLADVNARNWQAIEDQLRVDPRTHSEEQINQVAASIQAFGWTNPILVGDGSPGGQEPP